MAYYSESAGYCAEEARRPYYGEPGFYHGEGGERYAVRKEYEEVDEVAHADRRGYYGGGHHGHLGHSGSGHGHLAVHEGSCHGHHLGEHREHHHGYGHGHGGRMYDACESKRYDSCTGQYYA